jgi:hypothetical protein
MFERAAILKRLHSALEAKRDQIAQLSPSRIGARKSFQPQHCS